MADMTVEEALRGNAHWTPLETAQARQVLAAEVRRLRRDCAEAYQCCGYMRGSVGYRDPIPSEDDMVMLLDNLSAAASGLPRPHDNLLPWPKAPLPTPPQEGA